MERLSEQWHNLRFCSLSLSFQNLFGMAIESLIISRLDVMSGMAASDNFSEQQARQMKFDLETAHNAFSRALHNDT